MKFLSSTTADNTHQFLHLKALGFETDDTGANTVEFRELEPDDTGLDLVDQAQQSADELRVHEEAIEGRVAHATDVASGLTEGGLDGDAGFDVDQLPEGAEAQLSALNGRRTEKMASVSNIVDQALEAAPDGGESMGAENGAEDNRRAV